MLSQEASAVVASFGQQPGVTREHLDKFNRVLNDSPELTRQINEAVQLLSSAHASRRPCPRSDQMAEQVRSRPRFPVAALVVAMGLIASCASSTSASTAPSFSGQWAYAKKCDLGHYLSLHLQQHGDRVTGIGARRRTPTAMMDNCRDKCVETRCMSVTAAMTGETATPHAPPFQGQRISSGWKMGNLSIIRSTVLSTAVASRFIRTSLGRKCLLTRIVRIPRTTNECAHGPGAARDPLLRGGCHLRESIRCISTGCRKRQGVNADTRTGGQKRLLDRYRLTGSGSLISSCARLMGPMCRPDACKATVLGFNHRGPMLAAAVDEGGCWRAVRRTKLHRAGRGSQ